MSASLSLSIALSSCPNDTFAFRNIILSRKINKISVIVSMLDINELNNAGLNLQYDIIKMSFPAFFRVKEKYSMLSAGAAIGEKCGPVVVSKRKLEPTQIIKAVLPGDLTTASYLFRLWNNDKAEIINVPFHKIIQMVVNEEADAGVIIHEGRFIYEKYGLKKIIDLGEWWETESRTKIPLAGIFIRKEIDEEIKESVECEIRRSIADSKNNFQDAVQFTKKYAQEFDEEILKLHINTYVTDETEKISSEGMKAIEKFMKLISSIPSPPERGRGLG